jgi:glucose/arabinose dehydrogenase
MAEVSAMQPESRPLLASGFSGGPFALLIVLFLVVLGGCGGTATSSTNDAAANAPLPAVTLTPVVSGLSSPLDLQDPHDGSGRLFVVEQPGTIRILQNGSLLATPFLDIHDRVLFGGERGLLGLTFHPNFPRDPRFFVNYIRSTDRSTVIAEFRLSNDPNQADATSERQLLVVSQPYANHKAGQLAFGADGDLYFGLGDGGSEGDPNNNGQNTNTLLGSMLRINVDTTSPGKAYGIPADNPFVNGGGAPEIFAYGFRNPWRFSFDRPTSRVFVADVGQDAWEEIDLLQRGGNYGWHIMEGFHCYQPPQGCNSNGLQMPIAEYGHNEGESITGGYVYHGSAIPGLAGAYVFGDYVAGTIWILQQDGSNWQRRVLLSSQRHISSFGQDASGELYVIDYGGSVLKLAPQ